jgi:hypothetical protein
VHFGNLDFFVTTKGELAWALVLTQPPCSADIGTIIKALKELHLHALEACAPGSD